MFYCKVYRILSFAIFGLFRRGFRRRSCDLSLMSLTRFFHCFSIEAVVFFIGLEILISRRIKRRNIFHRKVFQTLGGCSVRLRSYSLLTRLKLQDNYE